MKESSLISKLSNQDQISIYDSNLIIYFKLYKGLYSIRLILIYKLLLF